MLQWADLQIESLLTALQLKHPSEMSYNKLIYQLLWVFLSFVPGYAKSPCGEGAVGVGTYQRFVKKDSDFAPQSTQISVVFSSDCTIISKTDTTKCNNGWDQGVTVDCGNSYLPELVTIKNAKYDCEDNIYQDIDTGSLCDVHTDELIIATWVQDCCKLRGASSENTSNAPGRSLGYEDNGIMENYTVDQRRRR